MTINKHSNRLPQNPPAHQAGQSSMTKRNRDIRRQRKQTPEGQTEKVKRLTPTGQITN